MSTRSSATAMSRRSGTSQVINALLSGPEGRIAVTYMEWAAAPRQTIGWTIIDSEKAAHDFADRIAAEPVYGERRTSISGALYEAVNLIEGNDIVSHRQVIDVSGDGANNSGPPVEEARDFALKRDITINGLPILLNANGPRQGYDIDSISTATTSIASSAGRARSSRRCSISTSCQRRSARSWCWRSRVSMWRRRRRPRSTPRRRDVPC